MPFDVQGLQDEIDALASAFAAESLEEELEILGGLVREEFELHFQLSMGPRGKWPPRKHYYPWPILIKTGRLREAATRPNTPGNINRVTEDTAEFGVDGSIVDYAAFHEYGTSKLPPRPWCWVPESRLDEAEQLLADLISKRFFDGPA